MSDHCLSLAGTRRCPAFAKERISTTDASLVSQYPFLANVATVEDFDNQLEDYVTGEYTRSKYQDMFHCDGIDSMNSSEFYARYTTSVICNSIIQNSRHPCGTSREEAEPLCADSCAQFAESEESIILNNNACRPRSSDQFQLIRADFTTCVLPNDSLGENCINGADNEPEDCGFGSVGSRRGANLLGLCRYCAKSSPNATHSCCIEADTETRCHGVDLPSVSLPPLFPSPFLSLASSNAPGARGDGLSAGETAGAVVGGVAVGTLILLAALLWILRRRQRNDLTPPELGASERKSSLTPASAAAQTPVPVEQGQQQKPQPEEPFSGTDEPPKQETDNGLLSAGTRTALPDDRATSARNSTSSRDDRALVPAALYAATPIQPRRTPPPPPLPAHSSAPQKATPTGSCNEAESSHTDSASPSSTDHSERLSSFKDYYSPDNIHPNDEVAVLWPYQPRAPDEFQIERGEMLRVVGIWDDGWATGYKVASRAEDWGVGSSGRISNAGSTMTDRTVDVKAFPLICVCLPQYWQGCIDADIP